MSLFEQAAALEKSNKSFALITITSSKGSAPRNQGRMIVLPDGTTSGTIGGGPAEKLIMETALDCLEQGESRSVSYRLDSGTSDKSIGMICGGDMDFFIEVFLPKTALFLTGGGHINQAVSRLADFLNYPYAVADTRVNMSSRERFPHALCHIQGRDSRELLEQGIAVGCITENTAILIATHNHDDSALREALKTPASYIGMLGSKRKVRVFAEKMMAEGVSRKDLTRLHAPVGLDLGTETPEEIALSILAEIMKHSSQGSGRSLSLFHPVQRKAPLAIIRGAGDLATGTISKLSRCGFRVAALEMEKPTVIRRTVSFAQAMMEGRWTVEGMTAVKAVNKEEIFTAWEEGCIPVIPDPSGGWIKKLQPEIVIDAIIAKKNYGTHKAMAPVVIALGPGFKAGEDVHAIIETNRGHNLGTIIREGEAEGNTGIPGNIAGFTAERVVRAPVEGTLEIIRDIGSLVKKGEGIARIGKTEILSPLSGVVRGMIASGTPVTEGFKIADVDPRGDDSYCYLISDKARAIAGGVLEAILTLNPGLLAG